MFKSFVIDPAFDSVALISTWLKALFDGNGSDHAAGWIMVGSLICITGSHALLVQKWSARRMAVLSAAVLVILLGTGLAISLASREVIEIDKREAKPSGGHSLRIRLDEKVAAKLSGSPWRVVETVWRHAAFPSLQAGVFDTESHALQPVIRDGGGKFFLNGQLLYFSSQFDPQVAQATTHWLVIERPWRRAVWQAGAVLVPVAAVLMLGAWLSWLMIASLAPVVKKPGFLVIGAAFLVYYGSHQFRFLHHDHRMQMVTSRDDDGYMMGRLEMAGSLQTMDPLPVANNAYGAIAYYPFAALPAAAGKLGFQVSMEALNGFVRGIKLLSSLLMLAAVWTLVTRHFGRAEGIVATVYTATFYGFLKYSSYPFYPDVQMAAFALLAMNYSLDLLDGWNDRSFILATICASMSVAIKFISFMVFPLLLFCALWPAWKKRAARPRGIGLFFATRIACFAVVSAAVFFLCNPYLDYNLHWIVPNMTSVQNLYTASTPNQVVPEAASLPLWMTAAYVTENDYSALIAMAISLAAFAVIAVGRLVRWPVALELVDGRGPASFQPLKSLAVLMMAMCWSLYFFRSINLPGFIDERLVLAVYPLFFALATQSVRLFWPALRLGDKRQACPTGELEADGAS